MDTLTTITPKFQVHIPVSVRKQAGLTQHGKAIIRAEKSKIIIEPVKSRFMSLAGKYKVAKSIPAEKIRDLIEYTR